MSSNFELWEKNYEDNEDVLSEDKVLSLKTGRKNDWKRKHCVSVKKKQLRVCTWEEEEVEEWTEMTSDLDEFQEQVDSLDSDC